MNNLPILLTKALRNQDIQLPEFMRTLDHDEILTFWKLLIKRLTITAYTCFNKCEVSSLL